MTREEAIKVLNTYDVNFDEYRAEEIADAIDMAIEALSQPIVAKHFDIQSGYIYCSPQIAENVKVVVRCKDCEYYKCCEVFNPKKITENDYCSWGERREE